MGSGCTHGAVGLSWVSCAGVVRESEEKSCPQTAPPQTAVTRAAPAMARMFVILICLQPRQSHDENCLWFAQHSQHFFDSGQLANGKANAIPRTRVTAMILRLLANSHE